MSPSPSRMVALSKFLSYVLRHRPEEVGLTLQAEGWIEIAALLAACSQHGHAMTREELDEIVRTSDKQRFAVDATGERIRANQGHSAAVEMTFAEVVPPALLYHGTADRFLESIRKDGLRPGSRHHVHLSGDEPTARAVGTRHGRVVILVVEAGRMHADGLRFFRSENGVWLAAQVPAAYLQFPG